MNRIQTALTKQCDALLNLQNNDKASETFGGFSCPACGIYHGRADNAVFPLAYAYKLTGDGKYLAAAEKTLTFRQTLTDTDGGVFNDLDSAWKGITVFSALGFYKTLVFCADVLPGEFRNELERLFAQSAKWVHENLFIGAKAYINYYAASAAVNAAAGKYFGKPEYTQRAKELLSYCLSLFTENGLLCGEGQPHDGQTAKGCRPIDVGYNAEESLPTLTDAAHLLGDEEALKTLACHAEKMLDFMLPDGGWDNSFGLRNNKWTYWGSRTSDGCIAAFYTLSKHSPALLCAAQKNAELMIKCSKNGLLYGGRDYEKLGQPPCVHHTLTHAVAFADASENGFTGEEKTPPETTGSGFSYKYYPELDTYKIKAGPWLATVTGYDYATGNYPKGASHASGGALSLLYHPKYGAVLAGSTYDYQRTEPNNMQSPIGELPHETLLMRAEYDKNGIKYATCLDFGADVSVETGSDRVSVSVTAGFADGKEHKKANETLTARFSYVFTENETKITCEVTGQTDENVKFIVPVVENSAQILTNTPFSKRRIFFLTGGFAAEEYTFTPSENKTELTFR